MRIAIVWAVAALIACSPQDSDKAAKSIVATDLKRHQAYLASDELQGRDAGSEGGHRAALYIAEHLERYGFEPGGEAGSWFASIGTPLAYGEVADANVLRVFKDRSMKASDDYKFRDALMPLRASKPATVSGDVVFAGYGITAPEHGYDDYKGVKAAGAIVLVLDAEPQRKDPASVFAGDKPTKHSQWAEKIANAARNGAAALLIVDPDEAAVPANEELQWPPAAAPEKTLPIPVAWLTAAAGEALAKAGSRNLAALRNEIDKDLKPRTFKVSRPARLSVSYRGAALKGEKNILGIWRGSDEKLKEEWVVLGAHYDHVGMGRSGSRGKADEVHNGADDNASGTVTLLEIAEALSMTRPRRSFLLLWFDAEEKGLNGSRAWCASPTVPLDKIVGMLNLDMVGRNETGDIKVGVEGGSDPKFPKLVKLMNEAERRFGLKFDWDYVNDQQLMQRSDHWSFMQKGVPATFFHGGLHADYHTERDDVERINFQKEELTGRIAFWMAMKMASMEGGLR